MKKEKKSKVKMEEEVEVVKEEKIGGETRAELRGMYAVFLREIKRYFRDRSRIVTAITSPLVWLILFGVGFAGFFRQSGGINYVNFIFPGIVCQSLLFTSVFLGISVIYDRQFGFLKEMLIAPIRRISVFSGKMFGGATDALIQGSIVLLLSFIFGVTISPVTFLSCLPIMLLTTIGFVSMSIIIASRMRSFESFGLIVNLVNLPLFFSSGALFPVSNTPQWLPIVIYNYTGVIVPTNSIPAWFQVLNMFNPLTYAVDALRGIILGNTVISFTPATLQSDILRSLIFGNNLYPIWLDIIIVAGFAALMLALGAFSFRTRK
ncbi:MAG: ABC transporter permease [Candidatus Freyarchaeum deiterrae]